MFKKNNDISKIIDSSWKEKNQEYLHELQKFLDKADNIKDDDLRLSIIYQMLNCDKVLTNLSENLFEKFYVEGLKNRIN